MSNTLFIHLLYCSNCDQHTRADRIVPCFRCGEEMEYEEKVGEIET